MDRSRSRAARGSIAGALALLAALVATGCTEDGAAERTTLGSAPAGEASASELPAELQLHLDSGNIAYRARAYDEALRHFGAATRMDPELAAGWYGVGMTHTALENTVAADSAMAMVHLIAPDIQLQHPVGTPPPNPHPVAAADGEPAAP